MSVFIGTQVFLIIAILRDARSLILMHPNAARRNAMTSPVFRYTRMLAPVSRCAGPCPDAGAAIAMYFTSSRCRRPYRDTGQPPRCNKIIAGKFTFLLMSMPTMRGYASLPTLGTGNEESRAQKFKPRIVVAAALVPHGFVYLHESAVSSS